MYTQVVFTYKVHDTHNHIFITIGSMNIFFNLKNKWKQSKIIFHTITLIWLHNFLGESSFHFNIHSFLYWLGFVCSCIFNYRFTLMVSERIILKVRKWESLKFLLLCLIKNIITLYSNKEYKKIVSFMIEKLWCAE